jgi:DNA-binding transcriptional ArsR family regulator
VIARLIGDSTRSTMLTALLDGRALTAGELARLAGVAPPTASAHLARLLDGGVVEVLGQGRHRYYRLAGADVAHALEALAAVSPPARARTLRSSAAASALRPARLCYDHLAGELGVRVHDHLVEIGAVELAPNGLELTADGERWFERAGVDVAAARARRRPLLRACLDWTERRHHLAGSLAAELATSLLERGWLVRRAPGERGLRVSDIGASQLETLLSSATPQSGAPVALPLNRGASAQRRRRNRATSTGRRSDHLPRRPPASSSSPAS